MNPYAAIRQLQRSERGNQAMRDLYAFLKNGGGGLDSSNQEAVLVILQFEFAGNTSFRDWGDIHLAKKGGAS